LLAAMRSSRGGRNLVRLGLDADIEFCSRADRFAVVPVFDPAVGRVSAMTGRG
jgi:phosphosulfolactate phosphohydrolase-like enzyme